MFLPRDALHKHGLLASPVMGTEARALLELAHVDQFGNFYLHICGHCQWYRLQ